MKKSKLIATAVLASTLVLAGCDNGKKPCSHVDEKAPWHYCDLCNEKISDCKDDNHDHKCDLCDEKMSEHSFGEWSVKVAATFEEAGVEERVCSVCGEKETREIPKLEHKYSSEWSHDDEKHWHACSDAGYESLRKDEEAHSFGDWQVKTPATYEAEGLEYRVCKCGKEETRPIAKLVHHYSDSWAHDDSKHWHACTDAGFENLKKDEEAHSFGEWSEKSPASFDHKKVEHRFCEVCNHEEVREVGEVLPHNYSSDWSSDDNKHWHACTDAGYESLRKDEAAHNFGEVNVIVPPTCDEPGSGTKECSVCHKVVDVVIPAAGHAPHFHNAIAPKCEEDGEIAYYTCDNEPGVYYADEDCKVKLDSIVDPAIGHHKSDDYHYDKDGHWFYCDNDGCDKKYEKEAHDLTSWSVVTPASFEADGFEERHCKSCDYHEERTINKYEHSYSKDLFQGEDTHYYKCLDEGFEDLKLSEGTHNFGEWKVVKSATFEEEGLKQRSCSDCGKLESEPIPCLDHNYSSNYSFDEYEHWISCVDAGYESLEKERGSHVDNGGDGICDVCGQSFTEGYITNISVSAPLTVIGNTESMIITANITRSGACDVELLWEVYKGSNLSDTMSIEPIDATHAKFTVLKASDSSTYYTRTIKVSDMNSFTSGTLSITAYCYPNSRISALKTFMGSADYEFPYFVFKPDAFVTSSGVCQASYLGTDTLMNGVKAFRNNGHFEETYDELEEKYFFTKTGSKGVYEFTLYDDADGYTHVECRKSSLPVIPDPEYLEFPMDIAMKNVRGLIGCDIIAPVGPERYTVPVNSTLISAYGNPSDYVDQLVSADYYSYKSGTKTYCDSPDGSLEVEINDKGSYFTIKYSPVSKPTQFDWTDSEKQMMMNFAGEVLPFANAGYIWMDYESELDASTSYGNGRNIMIAAYENDGSFVKSETSEAVEFRKSFDFFTNLLVTIRNDGIMYVVKEPKQFDSWKGEELAAYLGVDVDDIPAPAGTSFAYQLKDANSVIVEIAGDYDVFKQSLLDANYLVWDTKNAFGTVNGFGSVNSERTINISSTKLGDPYKIQIAKHDAPKGDDWSDADKEAMIENIGEVLPFVKDDFAPWGFNGGVFSTYSNRPEAQYVAKDVFDKEESFVPSTSGNSFLYTKPFDKYSDLQIELTNLGYINANKKLAQLETWEADDIAAALVETQDVLPNALVENDKITYNFSENKVVLTITGSVAGEMDNYRDVLVPFENAQFVIVSETNTDVVCESLSGTLTVALHRGTKSAKSYTITATAHLPKGQYRVLPVADIAKQLNNDPSLANLPLPGGTLFFYEANVKYECDVTVLEGGSMSNYISALEGKGFVLNEGAYESGNLRVAISAGEGDVYSAHLSLIEKPAIEKEWSEEEKAFIAENMSYNDFLTTTLPCPITSSSTSIDYGSYRLIVNDGDIDEYAAQLEEAGLTVSYDSYWERYKVYESYSCYMYVSPSTGTNFVITWQY